MGLSEAQRTERLGNAPHLRYRYRSGWGLSMLTAAYCVTAYCVTAGAGTC